MLRSEVGGGDANAYLDAVEDRRRDDTRLDIPDAARAGEPLPRSEHRCPLEDLGNLEERPPPVVLFGAALQGIILPDPEDLTAKTAPVLYRARPGDRVEHPHALPPNLLGSPHGHHVLVGVGLEQIAEAEL